MAVRDYTGRSVDLFIMQGARESGMRAITPSWGSETGGEVTTGVQKAAQLFVTLFLTEKNVRVHDPEFGTRFLATARGSNLLNDARMQIAFRDAADDILQQQILYRGADAPDDEIISDIQLVSFSTPSPDQLSLSVQLTTLAGSTRVVILPVSLAIK